MKYVLYLSRLGGSATSSPAMLGIREHRLSKRRAQSSMQLYNYYGDTNRNKNLYTGKLHCNLK